MEGQENLRSELVKLNDKIENLKLSEDERLVRELQAVELNIQETQRQLKIVSTGCRRYKHRNIKVICTNCRNTETTQGQ